MSVYYLLAVIDPSGDITVHATPVVPGRKFRFNNKNSKMCSVLGATKKKKTPRETFNPLVDETGINPFSIY